MPRKILPQQANHFNHEPAATHGRLESDGEVVSLIEDTPGVSIQMVGAISSEEVEDETTWKAVKRQASKGISDYDTLKQRAGIKDAS